MKTRDLIYLIIIAALALMVFMLRECDRPCPEFPAPSVVIDTIHDTTEVAVYIPAPDPDTIIDSIPVTGKVDTALILADYYKYRSYTLELKNDDTAQLFLHTGVFKNELQGSSLTGRYFTYTVTNTVTNTVEVEKQSRKIFIGLQMAGGVDHLGVAPGLMYMSKKDHPYSLAYDPINKQGYGTIWYKINLRRKR